MDLKRGIDKAVKAVTEHIAKSAEQVGDNYDKIEQVATVSANNDKEIGELLAEAMRKVSKDGVITIECGRGYAVRSWLSVSLLHHRQREDGMRDGEPIYSYLRQEDL